LRTNTTKVSELADMLSHLLGFAQNLPRLPLLVL